MGRLIQVGAVRRGSAHGGASPLLFYSAGSGCPLGPKAQVSPGRLLGSHWGSFVALGDFSLHSSSFSKGVASLFAFSVSFPGYSHHSSPRSDTTSSTDFSALVRSCFPPFRPLPCVRFSPLRSPHRFQFQSLFPFRAYLLGIVLCLGCVFPVAGSVTFSSASSSVSSGFLPFCSLSLRPVLSSSLCLRPLRFSRRLPAHMAFRLFPRSPSGSRVLPPLFRGSVSVARGSRRSAPTPLQRSGKVHRDSDGK